MTQSNILDLLKQEVKEITPMKRPTEILTVRNMMDNISATIAPPEFQRPEAWNSKDCKGYFQSFLLDRLEGSFVFVDLIRASASKKLQASDDPAKDYFQKLKEECFNYITLDGNNRFNWFTRFFNDEYTIPRGSYKIIMGDSVDTLVVGTHNRVFSKLSPEIQHELKSRKVVVNTYTEIGYKGLSDVFLNVNAGCPLNRQEKRNAFGTEYADFIRELSDKFSTLLIRIHNANYKKRLKGDEWLVDTIIFSEMQPSEVFAIAQSKKDYDYTHNVPDKDKVVKNLTIIEDIINHIDKTKVRPNSVANVFWLISNYEGEITDELVMNFFDINDELYRDNTVVNDDGSTFYWACNGTAAKNNELKLRELSKVLEAVTV
jgi:hypothetical protein